MAVRDMILTPIMCFGGYKINWEWIGTVWKNNTFLCAKIGQWQQPQDVGGRGLGNRE